MARRLALVVSIALCALVLPGAAPPTVFTPGAPGVGDPYYPLDGNGGYDVTHYDLDLTYDPETDELSGTATIEARATQNLSAFNLDFIGLEVDSVEVDGASAAWTRDGQELTIAPTAGIRNKAAFTVAIAYHGVPEPLPELGGSGFIHTDDGAVIVGEPHGAATWFPANDHPTDKASFTFHWTVPEGLEVVANGVPKGQTTDNGWTTWTWDAVDPMATYLATATSASSTSTPTRRRVSPTGMPSTRSCSSHRSRRSRSCRPMARPCCSRRQRRRRSPRRTSG